MVLEVPSNNSSNKIKDPPILQRRKEFLQAVKDNQIVIVVGETGCGKTTQIPQLLVRDGYTSKGRIIGCTQPRRIAATSVAKQVAKQFPTRLGDKVGYKVRFDKKTSHNTVIKYMTDGMLLREYILDTNLSDYSVIILDEAHERSIPTDILFGVMKGVVKRRPDIKMIVSSASLETTKFSEFFNDALVFDIAGSTQFPVDHRYTPPTDDLDLYIADGRLSATLKNYEKEIPVQIQTSHNYGSKDKDEWGPETVAKVSLAINLVIDIHINQSPERGDILVFLTGQELIEKACKVLELRMATLWETKIWERDKYPSVEILPMFAALDTKNLNRVFTPTADGMRKIIFGTNVAETSLTIPGLTYVIDAGLVKQNKYFPENGFYRLAPVYVSQAQVRQRSGRAGRTHPGVCYHLYTKEENRKDMTAETTPTITIANLSGTILQLKSMGIDVKSFDYMDTPSEELIREAIRELKILGALDQHGTITALGKLMADFPLEPALAKALINSVDYGCSIEVATIVSMLSVENVFVRRGDADEKAMADMKKRGFNQPGGDLLTLLHVFNMWRKYGQSNSAEWCEDNYLHCRALKAARDVQNQLKDIMNSHGLALVSATKGPTKVTKIQQAICSGFLCTLAMQDPNKPRIYNTRDERGWAMIHPSSALVQGWSSKKNTNFNFRPQWVVYHRVVLTSKPFMRNVTPVDPAWLNKVAPTIMTELKMSTKSSLYK